MITNIKLHGGYLYYSIGYQKYCLLPLLTIMEYRDLGIIELEMTNKSRYTDMYGNDESDYDYEEKYLDELTQEELEEIIIYEIAAESQEIEEVE